MGQLDAFACPAYGILLQIQNKTGTYLLWSSGSFAWVVASFSEQIALFFTRLMLGNCYDCWACSGRGV